MRNSRNPAAADVIKQRILQIDSRRGYVALALRVLLIALVLFLVFSQIFLLMRYQGEEMFPAVKDGDLLIAFRLTREYQKNDIVIYSSEGKRCVGRVIAGENDVVEISEQGVLYVNGTAQYGEIMYPTYPGENITYPYRVPGGHVFILKDYRTQADDSRNTGSVPVKDVKAKVITLLRRRGL